MEQQIQSVTHHPVSIRHRLYWISLPRPCSIHCHLTAIATSLRCWSLPYIQRLPSAIFQQDNVQPHMTRNVQEFCTHQIELLSSPACSPDLSCLQAAERPLYHKDSSKASLILCRDVVAALYPTMAATLTTDFVIIHTSPEAVILIV
ncbi:hypothetical protein TNCV_3918401 [Trichonephila clavipes]|nr:hypothetical protein TNCV_3918401 [Trichonephila clavipes]